MFSLHLNLYNQYLDFFVSSCALCVVDLTGCMYLKKWKRGKTVNVFSAPPFFFSFLQIITNYMSDHIWAFPVLISIILWCNRISWVSSTPSLNVMLGRRSDLPWQWLAHSSFVQVIDRSSKAQSRRRTAE